MATHARPGTEALYALHDRWMRHALPDGGSLITPDKAIWTDGHLDELEKHFVGQPDLTKDKKFLEKLRDQLAGCSDGAVQLMAELHIVHFLHVWIGAISATKKRADVETILSWMTASPGLPEDVVAALEPGLIHPGQWVLSRRDTQLTWLIHFALAWRRLAETEQSEMLEDPWALKSFLNQVEAPSAESARLELLHMAHPDRIEPITSAAHKEAIAARFADSGGDDPDIDRRLAAIRAALEPTYGEGFDWYLDDLDRRWNRNSKAWQRLLTWTERIRELPDFDEHERDYKLAFAESTGAARQAVLDGDPDWPNRVKAAFKHSSNNVTRWTVHDRFLRWLTKEPAAAHQALQAIWGASEPEWQRVDEFVDAVPGDVLANRGQILNIASFLLMGQDPRRFPPFKVSVLRRAWRLVGWPRDTDEMTHGQAYRRGLTLFEEVYESGRQLPVPLRDPLDAQGALWAMLQIDEKPVTWPNAWWQELLAYREEDTPTGEVDDEPDDGPVASAEVDDQVQATVDHIAEAAKDLNVDRAHLDEIVQLLEDKDQVVVYGPPGTGKTYLALRLARAIAEGDDARLAIVQFHPASTYEDFIEGLRPRLTSGGQVTYEVVPGPLVRIAEAARQDPAHRYVLVIDEINRAHLPKVFGELLFLLEYRKERARMLHRPDKPFGLPENLWIIGTMNTADRSIALIDAAMRRRFHFVPFFPHSGPMKDLLRRWLKAKGGRVAVANLLDAVNEELLKDVGEHSLIGPSHFMRTDLSETSLQRIWTYNVFPLIEEHFWGDRERIDYWRWDRVRARFSEALGEDQVETGEDGPPGAQPADLPPQSDAGQPAMPPEPSTAAMPVESTGP